MIEHMFTNNAMTENQIFRRPIPSTGEMLPVIGLGTYRSFDVRLDRRNKAQLEEVLKIFFGAGGSLIDSSPMYGKAEAVVGEVLDGLGARDKAFVATKVNIRGKRRGMEDMVHSIRKLRCRDIELMQVHNLVDYDTHIETLRQWKAAGRFRYIGITHYMTSAFQELGRIMETTAVDFVQFPYSIAVPEAEKYLLPLAADRGVATLINRPFEQDGLFRDVRGRPLPPWALDFGCASWSQFFLKYILSHPAVTCAIPATGNPDHMRDNLGAGVGRLPEPGEREKMAD